MVVRREGTKGCGRGTRGEEGQGIHADLTIQLVPFITTRLASDDSTRWLESRRVGEYLSSMMSTVS